MACTSTFIFKLFILICLLLTFSNCKNDKTEEKDAKDKWKKKNVRDYSDADVERLFDQWEDTDEDELEEDELPEWKREPPKVDMSQMDPSNPENMLKQTKKGRTLMLFATVSGNPSQDETEKVTQIWQGSLFNANYEVQRYVVGDNRVIFMLKDGAKAWEIKDFLVSQDRCEEVTIEGKNYPGKAASGSKKDEKKSKESKDNKKSKSGKKDKSDSSKPKDNNTTKKKGKEKKDEL